MGRWEIYMWFPQDFEITWNSDYPHSDLVGPTCTPSTLLWEKKIFFQASMTSVRKIHSACWKHCINGWLAGLGWTKGSDTQKMHRVIVRRELETFCRHLFVSAWYFSDLSHHNIKEISTIRIYYPKVTPTNYKCPSINAPFAKCPAVNIFNIFLN